MREAYESLTALQLRLKNEQAQFHIRFEKARQVVGSLRQQLAEKNQQQADMTQQIVSLQRQLTEKDQQLAQQVSLSDCVFWFQFGMFTLTIVM